MITRSGVCAWTSMVLLFAASACSAPTLELGSDAVDGATIAADARADSSIGRADASLGRGDAGASRDASPEDAGSSGDRARQWCERAKELAFQRLADCYGGTVAYFRAFYALRSSVDCAGLRSPIDAARMVFDDAAAGRCLEVERSASCRDIVRDGLWLGPGDGAESCVTSLRPAVPPGGPCVASRECERGGLCDNRLEITGQCSHTCVIPIPVVPPTACDLWLHPCAPGFLCPAFSSRAELWRGEVQCTRIGREGEACGDDPRFEPCEYRSHCDVASNTCAVPLGEGSACIAYSACGSLGLECIATGPGAATCRDAPRAGDRCVGLRNECGPYADCPGDATPLSPGVCRLRGVLGEPCRDDGPSPERCASPAFCSAERGVCSLSAGVGSPCQSSRDCDSAICGAGTCQPLRDPPPDRRPGGAPCEHGFDCQSEQCFGRICEPVVLYPGPCPPR